jgi:hypothetical protein
MNYIVTINVNVPERFEDKTSKEYVKDVISETLKYNGSDIVLTGEITVELAP